MTLLLIIPTAYTQEIEEAQTAAVQVENVLNVVGEKANAVMDSLATRFGTTAEEGFVALESYYFVRGVLLAVLSMSMIIASVLLYRKAFRIFSNKLNDMQEGMGILFCVIGSIIWIPTGIAIFYAIDFLSGPRRHAIKEIMEMLS